MTISSRITVAFALAFIPLTVALAAPGNVTGITGAMENGKATVRWQKPAGETPVSYRIFYSRESILQNNGLYDDFEAVPGTQLEYIFQALPYPTQQLYVSVLAVDAAGEESPLFVEEVRITTSGSPAPTPGSSAAASSAQASSAAAPAPGIARMLSAKATSATGVVITFSENVVVDPANAASAFVIKDASGSLLPITRLVVLGKVVTLHTAPQVRSRVYRLEVGNSVSGRSAQGGILSVEKNSMLLMGHQTGIMASPSNQGASSSASMGPSLPTGADVQSLQLRAQAQGQTYVVEATWVNPAPNVREYRVSQTRDDGRTYGEPQIVAGTANGVRIAGIPGGSFGLLVQAIYNDGTMSHGILQLMDLPVKGGLQGTVVPGVNGTGKGGPLTSSGIAVTVPMLLSGAGVGFQIWRRKRQLGSVDA
jgi:hypothetical protein